MLMRFHQEDQAEQTRPGSALAVVWSHPLERRPLSLAAAGAETSLPLVPLVLEPDADLSVWFQEKQGQCWLYLEHTRLPGGTLVDVEIIGPEDAPVWHAAAVLRPGVERAAPEEPHGLAQLRVPEDAWPRGQERRVRVFYRSAAELDPEDIEVLERSYRATENDDPAAIPFWHQWAEQALKQERLAPEVAAWLRGLVPERKAP
jgi:hypothetical protein